MADFRPPDRAEDPAKDAAAGRLAEETQLTTKPHKHKPMSLLESGVNFVTARLIQDEKWRKEVNHYSCEFAKTASLFAGGKAGFVGTLLVYGAAQASGETDALTSVGDFCLGAAKGGTIKSLFGIYGANNKFAATKGVLMGIASRGSEAVFQRDTLSNPLNALGRLDAEVLSKEAMLMDGAIFLAGEGLFHAARPLFRSQLASTMLMGGSFGAVNGAAGEIGRQKAAGESFDIGKVLEKSAIQAGIDAAAAGVGAKGSELAHRADMNVATERVRSSINNLHQMIATHRQSIAAGIEASSHRAMQEGEPITGWPTKEYVVIEGRSKLKAFRDNQTDGVMLNVRELIPKLVGEDVAPVKKMFVQRLRIGERTLLPQAAEADLVASCFPENLSAADRARHVFPEGHGQGRVWIQDGPGNRLRISAGWHPVSEWRSERFSEPYRLDGGNTTISVMAPLLVGDPKAMEHPTSKQAWEALDRDLAEAKALGIDSVSTDVWWGLVEPKKGEFNWSYYEKLAEHIRKAGLKWTPIISLHACGGNIGDTVNIKLPEWIWADVAAKLPGVGNNSEQAKFVSEQGNKSDEYVSVWATKYAVEHYGEVMRSFQEHFASYAPHIAEINISLGPAGELRYPSYNSHDEGTGYPTRGALQCYSELAKESFRQYVIAKYGGLDAVAREWGIPGLTFDRINPPDNASEFFSRNDHMNTRYGRDLIDWYNQSLLDHGNTVMGTALKVFASSDAAFAGVDLGAKIPGVHWRIGEKVGDNLVLGDRLAEVNAGLIRTSRGDWHKDEDGRGYRDLLQMLHGLQPSNPGTGSSVVPSFTAIEMPDGQDGPAARSMPRSLAIWVGKEAQRQSLIMKAENALAGNLSNPHDWDNISSLLKLPGNNGFFHGATFLRMSDVVNDPVARAKVSEIIHAIRSMSGEHKKAS